VANRLILLSIALMFIVLGSCPLFANDYGQYMDFNKDGVIVDIHRFCGKIKQGSSCHFKHPTYDIVITCAKGEDRGVQRDLRDVAKNATHCRQRMMIKSRVPVVGVYSEGKRYLQSNKKNHLQSFDGSGTLKDKMYHYGGLQAKNVTLELAPRGNVFKTYVSLSKVLLRHSTSTDLLDTLKDPTWTFLESLKTAKVVTAMFVKKRLITSHENELDRYMQALDAGIAVLKSPRYSLLSWRVQESMRRIVVFGVVATELEHEYGKGEVSKRFFNVTEDLLTNLRDVYSWGNKISGVVSKSIAALIELIELETKNIQDSSIRTINIKVYQRLVIKLKLLSSRIDTNNGGDLYGQRNMTSISEVWNKDEWQQELTKLITQSMKKKSAIKRNVRALIQAVNGLSQLTRVRFIIPQIELRGEHEID
jgi:hypothetical protein